MSLFWPVCFRKGSGSHVLFCECRGQLALLRQGSHPRVSFREVVGGFWRGGVGVTFAYGWGPWFLPQGALGPFEPLFALSVQVGGGALAVVCTLASPSEHQLWKGDSISVQARALEVTPERLPAGTGPRLPGALLGCWFPEGDRRGLRQARQLSAGLHVSSTVCPKRLVKAAIVLLVVRRPLGGTDSNVLAVAVRFRFATGNLREPPCVCSSRDLFISIMLSARTPCLGRATPHVFTCQSLELTRSLHAEQPSRDTIFQSFGVVGFRCTSRADSLPPTK